MSRKIASCLTMLALAALAAPRSAAADHRAVFPDTIALPDGFQPEGIAVGRGTTIYTGSIATGAIFAADVATGRGALLVPPQPGRAAIGISYDRRSDLLYVAGGPIGAAYVYDARTGATVAALQLADPSAPTFINDEVITDDAVYFTDSSRPVLYRLPLSRHARPAPGATATALPLTGDFVQVANAFNANGIVPTPDGRALLIVHSTLGAIYRVDPRTGHATTVDLGGATVVNGDGLFLRGDDLFVVQNQLNQIAVIDLDRRATRGELTQVITDDQFDIPTGADRVLGSLYVVNARFGTPPTPTTPYAITRVRLGRD
jgi:sugar lactone lactonase YvrE